MDHKLIIANNLRAALRRFRLMALRDNVLYPQWAYLQLHELGYEWEPK